MARLALLALRTAWVEGVDGDGVGETLTFRLEGDPEAEHALRDVPFRGLSLVNGYAKSESTWQANGRVREALLRVDGAPVYRLRFVDSPLPQGVSFPEAVPVRPGDLIALDVLAVYPGDRYSDTAISEIVLDGAH